MADCMMFPNTFDEFLEQYQFRDSEEVYTNGAMLVPVFRIKQWVEHATSVFTNADRIRAMNDEELAEYLFDRGNGYEYCFGICSHQDNCAGPHAQEFCIEQIVDWLRSPAKGGTKNDH